jgi:hypothetical protein
MLPFKITSDYGYIGRFGWLNSDCDFNVLIHIGDNNVDEWMEEGTFRATFQFFGQFFPIPRFFSDPEEALQLKLEAAQDHCRRKAAMVLVLSMFRSLGDRLPMKQAVSRAGKEVGANL